MAEERQRDRERLLSAAKAYTERGLAVVPIVAGQKAPSVERWQERRLTFDELAPLIRGNGIGGLGVVTGALSGGLAVLDFDGEGWQGALDGFLAAWPELRTAPRVRTGSGKAHIWLSCPDMPPSFTNRKYNRPDLGAIIELRGNRSNNLAPPSIHPSGGRYEWATAEAELQIVPFADVAAWLAQWAGEPEQTYTEHKAAEPISGKIPHGTQHSTLVSLAGTMRRRGMNADEIEAALQVVNETRCEVPGPRENIRKIAQSVDGLYDPADTEPPPNMPRLNAGENRLQVISADAWAAVTAANNPPVLYRQDGLGAVRFEHGDAGPVLTPLTEDRLRYETARAAYWYRRRVTGQGWQDEPAKPPLEVIRDMLAYPIGLLPLPPVVRIVRAPIFAANGALLAATGYYPGSRVIVALDDGLIIPPVPEAPDAGQLAAAVATFDDLWQDFPFTADADRAHTFGLMLTPFVRDMIPGPTPLHLVESPTAGTGKGLLTSCALVPAVGANLGTLSAGRDDEEWRKRITTVLRDGRPAVVIDNVRTSIDAAPLAQALTASRWDDRLLGGNVSVSLPVRCVWVATGNNPMLSTEIARRSVRIRLDPKQDQPWRRDASHFRHPEIVAYALERRGELIAAACTMVQAWQAAGRPRAKVAPIGSYESWSRVIGGILAHAGIAGFLENLDELYERADLEGAVWRRFVAVWWRNYQSAPVGVAELYPLAQDLDDFPLGRSATERGQKTALGNALRAKQDNVLGGYRIEKAGTYRTAAQYTLSRVAGGGEDLSAWEQAMAEMADDTEGDQTDEMPW